MASATGPHRRRRSYGTGSLIQKHGAWYGRWRTPDGRRLNRRIGLVDRSDVDDGLTRRQAERRFREMQALEQVQPRPPAASRITVNDAAEALRSRKRIQGVSKSYMSTLESVQSHHFGSLLGPKNLRDVHRRDVEAMAEQLLASGRSPKTVRNTLKILHGVFELAIDMEWTTDNPVRRAVRPRLTRDARTDLRYLTLDQIDAVVAAIPNDVVIRVPKASRAGRPGPSPPPPPDVLGPVLRVLIVTAAMTGLRQGELLALRWRDVDWSVRRLRVRQTWRRTEFSPIGKSNLSTRRGHVPSVGVGAGRTER